MSKRWDLNDQDLKRVLQNGIIFAAPALLVFFSVLQAGGTFKEASVALYTWCLSTVVDVLRKWSAGK